MYLCHTDKVNGEAIYDKQINRKGEVLYTLNWSKLLDCDKYIINAKVPSMPGIFELLRDMGAGVIEPYYFSLSWYGGLRNNIRQKIDPELEKKLKHREILENETCYCRYIVAESYKDMLDIVYYFAEKHFPHQLAKYGNSQRYTEIYIKEDFPEKYGHE